MTDRRTENIRDINLEANWGSIMGTSVSIHDPQFASRFISRIFSVLLSDIFLPTKV